MEELGLTVEDKRQFRGLWRRLKGSREIHVRTKGFWGPSRKGSLGVVLHSVT